MADATAVANSTAVAIHGKEDLRIEEREIPEPGEGEVRLAIAYAGICGSDLHYYFEGANGAFVVREPLVPGHEVSGVVDLDPSGALAPGTPVTLHPATFGTLLESIPNSRHLWPGGAYLGSASTWPHTQGGMSDHLIVRSDMVRVLPDGLPLRRAALAEPLGVALHAAGQAGDLAGADVLVVGSGPIGILQVAAALARGAASVAASDVLEGPLERARALGAGTVLRAGVDEIAAEGFDVVFECSGSPAGVNSAWSAVRRGGTVVQVGMMAAGPQPLALATLVSKEVTMRTSFRFDDEVDEAVELLAAHPEYEAAITHVLPAAQAREAFDIARDSQVSGKVLVALTGEPGV